MKKVNNGWLQVCAPAALLRVLPRKPTKEGGEKENESGRPECKSKRTRARGAEVVVGGRCVGGFVCRTV